MSVYISMLRGISVGGNRLVKMDRLRASFEALGFEQVQSYIQSGNVVFNSKKSSTATLSKRIAQQLLNDLGFPVSVVTRTVEEICRTVANNPFLGRPEIDPEKLHVTFLSDRPAPETLEKLRLLPLSPDQFACLGKDLYLYLPNGAGQSKLMKSPIDRLLAVVTTTRNWKTVNALQKLCQECG